MPDYNIRQVRSIEEIPRSDYTPLEAPNFPFFDYDFLLDLELSGCIGERTGWQPRYLLAYPAQGESVEPVEPVQPVGAVISFFKTDSYGEYIFDWDWASAYHQAGLRYYPKGMVAAPFTPANGPRFLIHTDHVHQRPDIIRALVEGMVDYGQQWGLSGWHILFIQPDEWQAIEQTDFELRMTHQYHWHNHGFSDFEQYLNSLRSKRRKAIKKERRELDQQGIIIELIEGEDIRPEHIERVWEFYMETASRKWGRPYLNRDFFERFGQNFADRTLLVMARHRDHPQYIAGTINFKKGKKLYGRYWGAIHPVKHLHFECCYYSLIDYALRHGLDIVEAGAQGEHKFARGFDPQPIYSAHFFYHPEGRRAVNQFLEAERAHTGRLIESYAEHSAFRKPSGPNQGPKID